jgi:ribosomal protein S18 acetylase RimI-like enzyme
VATVDALLAVYDRQMRGVEPRPPAGVRYERDGPLLRAVGGHRGYISGPRDIGVTGAGLDRLISRQRDYFAGRGEAVGWQTRAHDEPADLTARLRAAGFVPQEERTVLIGLTAELATAPVMPGGAVLRWVTADDDMHRIAALQSAVWGQDWNWLGENLIARIAAAPHDIAVLAAEADGDVVSAGWLAFFQPGADSFARLLGGSTLPQWRGRGIYRALVAARAQRAAARRVRYLQADASNGSAPILRRLGFRAVTTSTAYVWTPPQPPGQDDPGGGPEPDFPDSNGAETAKPGRPFPARRASRRRT